MMAVERIGIAGLGLLGRGIAASFLSHGFSVVAYDTSPGAMADARAHIGEAIAELVTRAGFDASLNNQWPSRYTEAADMSAFAACDFVIESVVEDLAVKNAVFDTIESAVRDTVPVASNTSALPISLLQSGRKYPSRFIGMHWCEPCHVNRFLEVIRGDQTNDATVEITLDLGRRCGKDPALVRKDIDGFIVNRIGYAMYREAMHLVESGVADVATIDRAVSGVIGLWANIAGPFRWMDLTGLPAYLAVMERLFPKLSCETKPPAFMRELVESGAKGVSNGRGFYDYTPEQAEHWRRLLVEHAWTARDLAKRYPPEPS